MYTDAQNYFCITITSFILISFYINNNIILSFQFKKSFFHDALGIGFDVRTEYENEFNDFGSWVDFLLKKDYREKFYYLFANPNFEPYDVNVLFTYAEQDATKEVSDAIINWIDVKFETDSAMGIYDAAISFLAMFGSMIYVSSCINLYKQMLHGGRKARLNYIWLKTNKGCSPHIACNIKKELGNVVFLFKSINN